MYLESKGKVHRDISYTNILLREPGKDTPEKKATRDMIIAKLGLSEIDELRKELGCREGLLIDFDYASTLVELIMQLKSETSQEGSRAGPAQDVKEDEGNKVHPNEPQLKVSGARTVSTKLHVCPSCT
jgi:serine/threonine protein kinase